MKKFIVSAFLIFFTTLIQLHAQPGFGEATKINDEWKFILNDSKGAQASRFNDSEWQTVDVPHDWSVKQPLRASNPSCMGYLPGGIGWYRKTFSIPLNRKNEKVYLYFEGIYNHSDVFVNGHLLGSRPNGYVSFIYDATPFINPGQQNTIAVRVDHSRAADSRWYTGSGIYRNVWLVYANPMHIAPWGVFVKPGIKESRGLLNISTTIDNNSPKESEITLIQKLFDARGKETASVKNTGSVGPGKSATLDTKIEISNPKSWTLASPDLYKLKTIVLQNGKQIDATETTTGFRNFTFDPNKGFALNGEWMKMKGVCLHHDAGVLGAAMYKEVWRRRLLNLKAIGVNAIRTSHNPQAPELYDLCDELGLLVLNEAFDEWEFPKRKWLEGWNQGTPGFEGSFDFFKDWGEIDLADMVRRDRNHVSVFAWSIGNEVDYPNDPYSHPILDGSKESGFTQKIFGGYKKDAPDAMRLGVIAKKLVAVVKKYDPTRPTTAGLAGVAMSNETEYPAALDITGYNYTESRYISDHQKYPDRIIYGSENRHDMEAWKAVTNNEHIFGQFLWTGIDYLGESGRWPSRGFYSGLLDFGGFIKPRGYFRQSLWSGKPMAYLGTYPLRAPRNPNQDVLSQTEGNANRRPPSMDAWPAWNYDEGQIIRVVCYTNTAKARLLLNGNQIGDVKPYDDKTGIIVWDVPYKPGQLLVEGLNATGSTIAKYTIETAQSPYALKVSTIGESSPADDIFQVLVEVVDKNNKRVMTAENEITVTVTGAAKLLGLEAGNNTDMGDYTDNKQKTYHGHLLAYVKRRGKGNFSINFSAEGLRPAIKTFADGR